jgi:hypothetical protein
VPGGAFVGGDVCGDDSRLILLQGPYQ